LDISDFFHANPYRLKLSFFVYSELERTSLRKFFVPTPKFSSAPIEIRRSATSQKTRLSSSLKPAK